ncbi:MAG: hypothetical protein QM831_43680 [Kofleriaceae bacterium]
MRSLILFVVIAGCAGHGDDDEGGTLTTLDGGGPISHDAGSGSAGPVCVDMPVDTTFLAATKTLAQGGYVTQQFTITTPTAFVFNYVADYTSQAAIFPPDQLTKFQTNKAFTGNDVFDNIFGAHYFTLAPGTYYLGVRSSATASNIIRYELDYAVALPSDCFVSAGTYFGANKVVGKNGGYLTQRFELIDGYRYFMDGANTGMDTYLIPESELAHFTAGATFLSYPSYSGSDPDAPGFFELTTDLLPAGIYYFVARNPNTHDTTLAYHMEWWRRL